MAENITVRQQCINKVRDVLQTMAPADPDGPQPDFSYSFEFSAVKLGPLSAPDGKRRLMAGIVTGRESKKTLYPLEHCILPLMIEFRLTVNRGDGEPAEIVERLLGEIQRRIHEDTHLGGLAEDLRETGNETDLDTYQDKYVQGVVMLELHYRHYTDDPFVAV
jgi:hypothetical protein